MIETSVWPDDNFTSLLFLGIVKLFILIPIGHSDTSVIMNFFQIGMKAKNGGEKLF